MIENIKNPLIGTIHLFLQGDDFPEIQSDKLLFIHHGHRPLFSDLFSYDNKLNDIKIVANSDIYFEDSLFRAIDALNNWNILALTRWDKSNLGTLEFYNNFKSQDAWIFKNIVNKDIGKFQIGRHGCDNKLVYEFMKNGYSINNPSFSIISVHLHNSNLRTYFNDPKYKYVEPPYDYLLPTYLSKLDIKPNNLRKQYYSVRYAYNKSKFSNTIPGSQFNFLTRIKSLIFFKYFAFKFNGCK